MYQIGNKSILPKLIQDPFGHTMVPQDIKDDDIDVYISSIQFIFIF